MFKIFKAKTAHQKELQFVLEKLGGGVHKRLDENRVLLELLQAKAPELLSTNPYVIGWLKANDEVFEALEKISTTVGASNAHFKPRPGFPRAWPRSDLR